MLFFLNSASSLLQFVLDYLTSLGHKTVPLPVGQRGSVVMGVARSRGGGAVITASSDRRKSGGVAGLSSSKILDFPMCFFKTWNIEIYYKKKGCRSHWHISFALDLLEMPSCKSCFPIKLASGDYHFVYSEHRSVSLLGPRSEAKWTEAFKEKKKLTKFS